MARIIKVTGIRRKDPDVHLFVLALIELARELEAKERTAKPATSTTRYETGGDL